MSDDLRIEGGVTIPAAELVYRAARSSGPGGQHVNTSATRVELTWNVAASASLDDEQRARILSRLASRIDRRGVLRLVEGRRRSQLRNREAVTERFVALIAGALKVPRQRKKTRAPRSAKERRIRHKKKRSEVKRQRRPVDPDDA
ncbi:MAG: aminoacyl-tRNA hydrolase [Gemmatimonadetes bacterium]|nr:aminoacyl-tRNA hydrolase [Gemmatimonadota bacterium]